MTVDTRCSGPPITGLSIGLLVIWQLDSSTDSGPRETITKTELQHLYKLISYVTDYYFCRIPLVTQTYPDTMWISACKNPWASFQRGWRHFLKILFPDARFCSPSDQESLLLLYHLISLRIAATLFHQLSDIGPTSSLLKVHYLSLILFMLHLFFYILENFLKYSLHITNLILCKFESALLTS